MASPRTQLDRIASLADTLKIWLELAEGSPYKNGLCFVLSRIPNTLPRRARLTSKSNLTYAYLAKTSVIQV